LSRWRVPLADAASFLSRYDDIFNPALRQAIANASVRPQAGRQEMSIAAEKFVVGTNEVVIASIAGSFVS
jgi:hypothetical protein